MESYKTWLDKHAEMKENGYFQKLIPDDATFLFYCTVLICVGINAVIVVATCKSPHRYSALGSL